MADTTAPAPAADPTAALAAVLALHVPTRRYKATPDDTFTFPTAQDAFAANQADQMCGYESVPLASPDEAEYVEVCAECSRIENTALLEAIQELGEDYDDADGTEMSLTASAWPCSTVSAITATPANPKENP